jgi:HSP20 family protein
MDRMMGSFAWPNWAERGSWSPDLDVSETDGEYRVCASLPGMRPEDVKVSVQGNTVTIEGERKDEQERKEGERSLYSERRYGSFSRTFTLPTSVNTDQARAEFNHGELRLTLPKSEAARPKQIAVQTATTSGGEKEREEVKVSEPARA